jgi:hypothetical protein
MMPVFMLLYTYSSFHDETIQYLVLFAYNHWTNSNACLFKMHSTTKLFSRTLISLEILSENTKLQSALRLFMDWLSTFEKNFISKITIVPSSNHCLVCIIGPSFLLSRSSCSNSEEKSAQT